MAPWEGQNKDDHLSSGLTPKFKDRPSYLGVGVSGLTPAGWMQGKRTDDNIGPYWRVHNKLYDLTDFAHKHPGGKEWLTMTKGTDITEAFESFHISESPEKLLPKYFVKDIDTPRNSPYTFHEDGFYKTFKRKARPVLKEIGRGPTRPMLLIQDGLFTGFIVSAIFACVAESYVLAIFAGVLLGMSTICAHNFFHQKDNFRMYYWDFSLLSSHEWRISHAVTHHLFTNTRYDLECTSMEPLLVFFPKPDKNFVQRYLALGLEVFLLPVVLHLEPVKRLSLILQGMASFRPENVIPFLEMVVMCTLASSVVTGIKLWLAINAGFAWFFISLVLLVAHHHPEIYHEGDTFRKNPDWGLCQLDAVRDRIEVKGNLFLGAISLGDHSLHHLLPTVDHSKLDAIYPVFFETCREFNIPFEFLSQWEVAKGTCHQIARNKPNPNAPGYKAKNE